MTDAEKLHKLADELGEDGLEDTALALHGFAGDLAAMTKRAEEDKRQADGYYKEAAIAYDKLAVMTRRAEEAECDAERYRWLRDRPSFIGWDWWQPHVPQDVNITPEFMDSAIDAARNVKLHD